MKVSADIYLDSDQYMYVLVPQLDYSFLIRADKGCCGGDPEDTEQHSIGSVMRRLKELLTAAEPVG